MPLSQFFRRCLQYCYVISAMTLSSSALAESAVHGMSLYGEPKYGTSFEHFDYANPDAPKQGELVMAKMGTFDSLHQFIDAGKKAKGLFWIYDRLTVNSEDKDEVKTRYGWLAEKMEVAEDYSSVTYFLRKEAKFSDGFPVTAEDVAFSLNLYRKSGINNIKSRFAMVKSVEVIAPLTVKINFGKDGSRLQVLNSGDLPVMPKHYWDGKNFLAPSLSIPVGSGPYKITSIDAGRQVIFELRDDYWGKNLAINKGKYNFKKIKLEYFRDRNASIQALKNDDVNYILENNLIRWNKLYQGSAFDNGSVVKNKMAYDAPSFVTLISFNLRKKKFEDSKTREALIMAFDFEWLNKRAFNNEYERVNSIFNNSFLAANGLITEEEKAILIPLDKKIPGQIPPQVFTDEFILPTTDASGQNRKNLLKAQGLLKEAGWKVVKNKLTHSTTGEVMSIDFLLPSAAMKPVLGPYIQTLKKLGISSKITIKTGTEYFKVSSLREFDMAPFQYKLRIPPNTQLRSALKSDFADVGSSYNMGGIKSAVVDALTEGLIQSDSYLETQTYGRALDRVLKWNHYSLPLWARNFQLVAYQHYIQKPQQAPKYGVDVNFMWDKRSQ